MIFNNITSILRSNSFHHCYENYGDFLFNTMRAIILLLLIFGTVYYWKTRDDSYLLAEVIEEIEANKSMADHSEKNLKST